MIHARVNLSPNIRARSLEAHVRADCVILHSFRFFYFYYYYSEHSDTNPSEKMNPDSE